MRTNASYSRGFTIFEIVVGIAVMGALMAFMVAIFAPQLTRGTDPLFSVRAAELGQSYLEEILGKRFAESSPNGNATRCGEGTTPVACTATFGVDVGETAGSPATFDDVDDYTTLSNAPVLDQAGNPRANYTNFLVTVAVVYAGADLGLNNDNAKRITVTITDPRNQTYIFAAYKANF